ncbi:MAG: HEPN domain-containing protein [Chthoniobacteraceae bacterium]
MPRKTDSHNPADWLWIAAIDLSAIQHLADGEIGFIVCRSKLAEAVEKIMKAELLRLGWTLIKTHELERLLQALIDHDSDLAAQADPLCAALAEAYFTDRYPGFDLDDPDWPALRSQLAQITALHAAVQARIAPPDVPAP